VIRIAGQLIDRLVDEAVTKPTRLFDTHPAVGDRILRPVATPLR